MKAKKLSTLVKSIPWALKYPPKGLDNLNYQISRLGDLVEGLNKGKILSCKFTNFITKKDDVPV